MIPALALLILGYDVAYYALNVLNWAHSRTDGADPVPFRYCIGIPMGKGGGAAKFKAPIRLGASYALIKVAEPRAFFGEGNFVWGESTIGTVLSDFFNKPGAEIYGTGANSTNPVLPGGVAGGGAGIGRAPTGGITSQNRAPSGRVAAGATIGGVSGVIRQ
jgi:hypothetical protein